MEKHRPAPRRRTILMMTGRGGGGHIASARAVEAALGQTANEAALDIRMVDTGYLLESIVTGRKMRTQGFDFDELYNALMRHNCFRLAGALGHLSIVLLAARGRVIRRGLAEFFAREQPDLVMSFVPFFNACFRDGLRVSCPSVCFVTCITDFSSTIAHRWIDKWDADASTRHYIVAGGHRLQQQAVNLGYPHDRVIATSGMVVHPSFHPRHQEAQQPRANPTALIFFGGCAPMRVASIVQGFRSRHPCIDLVVICGKNDLLRDRLTARGDCTVEGFVSAERVRQCMRAASFIVGKPGPGVVSEACATGTPYVTEERNVMPQERCVLDWIAESGSGVVLKTLANPPIDLLSRVEACRTSVAALQAAPPASSAVASTVRSLLEEARETRHTMLGNEEEEEEEEEGETPRAPAVLVRRLGLRHCSSSPARSPSSPSSPSLPFLASSSLSSSDDGSSSSSSSMPSTTFSNPVSSHSIESRSPYLSFSAP